MITQYDRQIKNEMELYLPSIDWRLLKAQLQSESALNPDAISSAGAMGIAQFMPATWGDMQKQLDIPTHITPYDAPTAITAAAYYMQQLFYQWTAPRPEADRYCLALASYNVGFGNMLKAQKKAGGASDYYNIISNLHRVPGVDYKQTTHYVEKTLKTWAEYITKGR